MCSGGVPWEVSSEFHRRLSPSPLKTNKQKKVGTRWPSHLASGVRCRVFKFGILSKPNVMRRPGRPWGVWAWANILCGAPVGVNKLSHPDIGVSASLWWSGLT